MKRFRVASLSIFLLILLQACLISGKNLTEAAPGYTPAPGDLGWGEVRGKVSNTIDGSAISGATVTCKQKTNHPVSQCSGTVTTGADGSFIFQRVFFQGTDEIELVVNKSNYGSQIFRQSFFTQPGLTVNFSLPLVNLTPFIMCTAPACSENQVLSCPGVCQGGCGHICATRTVTPAWNPTFTPTITSTPVTFACADCADPLNALVWVCPLAANDENARSLLNSFGEIQQGEINNHTCLYVVKPGSPLSTLYYVDQASSTIAMSHIDPSLLSPTFTPTP